MSENVRVIQQAIPTQNVYAINENVSDIPKKMNSFELVMSQVNIPSALDFKKTYTLQWQSAAIEKELLSVLLCEIDFYHEYVENHGDQGASFMMISIALLLKNICEQKGCFLSYNVHHGFSILIKGGTVQAAQDMAIELCDAVKSSQTAHNNSSVSEYITLSVGTSSFYPTTPATFKADAQKALNEAKVSGGNKVKDYSLAKSVESFAVTEVREALQVETVEGASKAQESLEEVVNKQDTLEEESATKNYQPLDYFAETEKSSSVASMISSVASKMYRGTIIEEEETAPVEVVVKKAKPVRMYRGQPILD